jgi:acyl carrier protein
MEATRMASLRAALARILAARGHHAPVGDQDSLFASGLLDSLAATEVIVLLESEFGLDLSDADFDVSALDSVASLAALIDARS